MISATKKRRCFWRQFYWQFHSRFFVGYDFTKYFIGVARCRKMIQCPSKIKWDPTNGPLSNLLELIDTQGFFGVRETWVLLVMSRFLESGGMESLGYLGIWQRQVVGILLQLPMPELQELVAVPKKFQDRLTEALKAVGWVKQRSNNKKSNAKQ